jgi:hypothetical protein
LHCADLLLHVGAYLWLTQLPVQLLKAGEEGEAKGAGHHVPRGGALLLLLLLWSASSSPSVLPEELSNLNMQHSQNKFQVAKQKDNNFNNSSHL